VPVLAEMELRGIRIDTGMLAAYSRELDGQLSSIEEEIYELCGHRFNIASTKQLQEVLFVERKLKPVKKTKTGYSTDVAVLQELAREDPVPEKVLRHRLLSKLRSTYVDALPKLVNAETGRLHTHFTQTGTATGRLSSKDPNLQNIPIRDEEGRRIRTAFVPADGWVFVSADYSQIELVVLAHLSGDPGLTRAFREGKDVHRETGALIFGVPAEEVTAAQRRIAKTINFGVMYGMSSFRLSRELNISRAEAESFIEAYFRTYPNIKSFVEQTVREAETHGAVRTLLGRERPLPDITSRNRTVKSGAERIAVNTPIQGTAADIVKRAMLRVDARLRAEGSDARILLQVHDELILEAPAAEREGVERIVSEEMAGAVELSVPLRVNVESGSSWGELH
jgi:DNA polymerase-1